MPVSYRGVLAEHKAVREGCGIFDVSHMGEIRVRGADAEKFLQWLTINDITKLAKGAGQYSAILNEDGGMIDDLIIYRLASDEFFICVNAANREKDFTWIKRQSKSFHVEVIDESDSWAQIAVQGPKSMEVICALLGPGESTKIQSLPYTNLVPIKLCGAEVLIARTGYTGELGFEIYLPATSARSIWAALMELSNKYGVEPVGLGARDTLRLEASYLLYGNDMDDEVSPLEAGIGWATKLDKGEFIGRRVLLDQKARGLKRRMVAFIMIDDGIPRHGMDIFSESSAIGKVTSGSVLPTVGGAGGMALVDNALKENDEIYISIRGQRKRAKIVKRPLYAARTK